MLDLDLDRPPVAARDAATLLLVRDGAAGLEVFCVERHQNSAFLGGALVFPGGKVDADDRDPAWEALITPPRIPTGVPADDPATLRAFAIAACRESLEEAAILPVAGGTLAHDELLALRAVSRGDELRAALAERGLRLDLAGLHPLARWVTPTPEPHRFDTRFYVCAAPEGQPGAHDDKETTKSFWARPADALARFETGEVQLLPPTHRTLEVLATTPTVAGALAACAHACLEPIFPRRVAQGTTVALVLPGDPEHEVRAARVAGTSRYVLRDGRWVAEDPPAR